MASSISDPNFNGLFALFLQLVTFQTYQNGQKQFEFYVDLIAGSKKMVDLGVACPLTFVFLAVNSVLESEGDTSSGLFL